MLSWTFYMVNIPYFVLYFSTHFLLLKFHRILIILNQKCKCQIEAQHLFSLLQSSSWSSKADCSSSSTTLPWCPKDFALLNTQIGFTIHLWIIIWLQKGIMLLYKGCSGLFLHCSHQKGWILSSQKVHNSKKPALFFHWPNINRCFLSLILQCIPQEMKEVILNTLRRNPSI